MAAMVLIVVGCADENVNEKNLSTRIENKDSYIGALNSGMRHGYGTYTWANGDSYVGQWKYGAREGQGTLTLANGQIYIGEWLDNKIRGQGTHRFSNGQKYIGEFYDGLENGKGTLYSSNGAAVRKGYWKRGLYFGPNKYQTELDVLMLDIDSATIIDCDVETVTTGVLFNGGQKKQKLRLRFAPYYGFLSKIYNHEGGRFSLEVLSNPGSSFENMKFINDDDCLYRGLWYCKSSVWVYEDNHNLNASLSGFDMGKKISSYNEALFNFSLNLRTGRVVYTTHTLARQFPFNLAPPLKTSSNGTCQKVL